MGWVAQDCEHPAEEGLTVREAARGSRSARPRSVRRSGSPRLELALRYVPALAPAVVLIGPSDLRTASRKAALAFSIRCQRSANLNGLRLRSRDGLAIAATTIADDNARALEEAPQRSHADPDSAPLREGRLDLLERQLESAPT